MMNQINAMGQMPMQAMAQNQNNLLANINQQMNDNQIGNNQTPSQNGNLTIKFLNPTQEVKSINVPCTLNEVFGDVVLRYWSKLLIKNPPPSKYIYNAKNVNLTLTVAESGIIPGSNIQVVQTEGIKGA